MFPKTWILLFLSIAITCPLLAQEGPPSKQQETNPLSQKIDSDFPGGTINELLETLKKEQDTKPLAQKIDVDFPGGTINELLNTIKVANNVIPNVIVSKEAARVVLPAIRLSSVSVSDTVLSLKLMREIDEHEIRVSEGPNVITIHAYPTRSPNPIMTRVFTTENLLSSATDGAAYTIDDIVTAITTTWKMNPEGQNAEIKYHNETKLLIAVGTNDQLNTVQNVLRELEGALRARKGDTYQKNIKMVTAELTELQNTMAQLKQENIELKAQLDALIKTLKNR